MAAKTQKSNTFEDARDKMVGKTSIVIDYEDETYTLKFPRALVLKMEREGITADTIGEMASVATLTGQEEYLNKFVKRAFETEQPNITLDDVIEIWSNIGDKEELNTCLVMLYMQPIMALTTDPTKTRAKFRLV